MARIYLVFIFSFFSIYSHASNIVQDYKGWYRAVNQQATSTTDEAMAIKAANPVGRLRQLSEIQGYVGGPITLEGLNLVETKSGRRNLVVAFSPINCREYQVYNPATLRCVDIAHTPCVYGFDVNGGCLPKCEFGYEFDGITNSCKGACQVLKDTERRLVWYPYIWGDNVNKACFGDVGATQCVLERPDLHLITCLLPGPNGTINPETECSADFIFNGQECDVDTPDFSGDVSPLPPPDPNLPDPEHNPDDPTKPITPDNLLPDKPANVIIPSEPTPKPDVEDPPTDSNTDTGVLAAVKNLNTDLNSVIHSLNKDLNVSQAGIQTQLSSIDSSIVQNTQATQKQQNNDIKIYENTKALIQQANADITTAVNRVNNSVTSLENSLDVGSFSKPTDKSIEMIFSEEQLTAIQTEIADKTTELEGFVDRVKDLIHINTNFDSGSLTDSSFEINGVVVKSGLQRFEDVSGQVRPVILFICALLSVWVLFGSRSK